MKTLFASIVALLVLNSCLYEAPFETKALVPVDQALIGTWEEVQTNEKLAANRLLVLQHSANEYLVQYPVGEKGMFFRAFAVDLEGQRCIQVQLIGTAKGPVETGDRKYHLVRAEVTGDGMELRTVDPDVLGKDFKDTDSLRRAFENHKNDARLFAEPQKFRKVPEPR